MDADIVIKAVCAVARVTEQKLASSRRGVTNLPRDLAIYALREYSQRTLDDIGQVVGCNNYSTVSSAIERMKKALDSEPSTRKLYEDICSKFNVSQKQT